jgi:uncharacterized protein
VSSFAKIADCSAFREAWIEPQARRYRKVARLLEATLDPGEAEAIALAVRAGLRVTGLFGELPRAKKDSQIQGVKPEVDALRTRARFYVSAQAERNILDLADE